jgi:hypothetical protein
LVASAGFEPEPLEPKLLELEPLELEPVELAEVVADVDDPEGGAGGRLVETLAVQPITAAERETKDRSTVARMGLVSGQGSSAEPSRLAARVLNLGEAEAAPPSHAQEEHAPCRTKMARKTGVLSGFVIAL